MTPDDLHKAIAAIGALIREKSELASILRNNGFVKCDTPACNCGSWHPRYGLPERMAELKEILADAGHPLCNKNGNQIPRALRALVAERDALLSQLPDPADICGFCGLPGADKFPHPVRWPAENSAGTELVHAECEAAECLRGSNLCQGREREEFLRSTT